MKTLVNDPVLTLVNDPVLTLVDDPIRGVAKNNGSTFFNRKTLITITAIVIICIIIYLVINYLKNVNNEK